MCSSTYNGQLLWDTVLDGWQAGILMVAGGRKDGWEERPRPPNPGWRLYGGSLSVRILIYAGTCRASQPLLHRAWNVWWQCRGCIAIYAVVCRASQPLLHRAWNVWWQCSNICAIYAQYMQVAAGLHSIYCIMHGMFGGNAATAQQYMRVAAGLAQPLFNYAWKNLDCGLGDMATDHMMLCRQDPLQKALLQGVPLQQKSLTLQYKRRASPSQIPFPPPTQRSLS